MPTPAPLCTHRKYSGATCGSPALKGNAFCFHHYHARIVLDQVVPIEETGHGAYPPIPFVFPEDRAGHQLNCYLLLQAFNEKRIDLRTFNAMQRMLRLMAANLKTPLAEDSATTPATPSQTAGRAQPPAEAANEQSVSIDRENAESATDSPIAAVFEDGTAAYAYEFWAQLSRQSKEARQQSDPSPTLPAANPDPPVS